MNNKSISTSPLELDFNQVCKYNKISNKKFIMQQIRLSIPSAITVKLLFPQYLMLFFGGFILRDISSSATNCCLNELTFSSSWSKYPFLSEITF